MDTTPNDDQQSTRPDQTTQPTQPISQSAQPTQPTQPMPTTSPQPTQTEGIPFMNETPTVQQTWQAQETQQVPQPQQSQPQPSYTQYQQPQQPQQPSQPSQPTQPTQPSQPSQPGTTQTAPWMLQQQYITGPGMSSKSKIVAGLFGIFFGGLGVHNFYLGKSGRAVIQLLLTCIGWVLFGLGPIASIIWGLVEGIEILGSHPGSQWHTDGNNLQLQD